MSNNLPGKGNRRPQLDVPIELIELDPKNPRITAYLSDDRTPSELDLLSILFENFDTEAVAMSMVSNGYFDEEPLIIVPKSLPKDFAFEKYRNVDELAVAIRELVSSKLISFVVVEGNRRLATIKLLLHKEFRDTLKIDSFYPKPEPDLADLVYEDISSVPCIIYEHRRDITSYLGVRHIAGLLKWEAFAKAVYVSTTIEEFKETGLTDSQAIKKVQESIGDRSDTVRKQYITYKIFLEARNDLNFDVKPIIENFSLLTVIYNSPLIRKYMGVEAYAKVNFDNRIVPEEKIDKLSDVLTWVYGNKKTNEVAVLTDSRKITNTLSYVVDSPEAVEYLKKFKDLDAAFERTSGEREYLSKNLTRAFRAVQTSLQFAYKYNNDEELLKQVKELEDLITVLRRNLTNHE